MLLTRRLALVLAAMTLAVGCSSPPEVNRNIRFGMPGPASKDPNSYLIDRPQYVLSYNAEKRTPNWICWKCEGRYWLGPAGEVCGGQRKVARRL